MTRTFQFPAEAPIASSADLAQLDARFADRQGDWWDRFYAERSRPVPFFGAGPDESLSEWLGDGSLLPGRALDVGCGNGRNAIFLARQGFTVEALDYSRHAVDWARQQAEQAGVELTLHHASVFELSLPPAAFDLLYDSGCFHHLPPHRRADYVQWVSAALRPGACFGLVCFRPEGGSGLSDEEVYRRGSLGGGLGYSEASLRAIWSGPFEILQLRPMKPQPAGSALLGEGFLWAMLARRRG